jgi:hypothetical protein
MMIDGKELNLSIRRMDSLHPHEETSDDLLKALEVGMADEWVQRDPIVVDSESSVILDGNHRLAALKSLGVCQAVCLEQKNYLADEEVRVFRWFRYIRKPREGLMKRLRAALGLSQTVSAQEAMTAVNSARSAIALVGGSEGFIHQTPEKERDSYAMVRSFDRVVLAEKEEVEIVEEDVGIDLVRTEGTILLTPPIEKKDVLRAGKTHHPLPYKTTLHVLPLRILGINISLSALNDSEKAQTALNRLLVPMPRFKILEPTASYEGRVYGERVVILER